jgi:hypothetical protein
MSIKPRTIVYRFAFASTNVKQKNFKVKRGQKLPDKMSRKSMDY